MSARLMAAIIFCGCLLFLKPLESRRLNSTREDRDLRVLDSAMDNDLDDDKISDALSKLSVDDLNTLNQLMDVFSEKDLKLNEDSDKDHKDQVRFKRENPWIVSNDAQNIQHQNADEEGYIKQLEESFPNDDQSDQDDSVHVRVKRE